jgi:hypothetical protein
MGRTYSFSAVIKNAGGGGAFVEVPFDVEKAFGSKRPKVRAVIAGIPYRGSLVRMGSDCHVLGVLKGIREQTGKTFGDQIKVTVAADAAPRVVALPADLAQALRKEKAARAYFNSLSYSHQREYVGHITEARREETRAKRIARTIELLKQGK